MKTLRHISDFLDLASQSGSRALSRACSNGNYTAPRRVTLAGCLSGWRFTVTSQTGSKWSIWIRVDEIARRYIITSRKVK